MKKDIDHTVEIPDTWGEVKIDLGGHTITGDKADDNNAAKPGLDFVKDGSTKEHPEQSWRSSTIRSRVETVLLNIRMEHPVSEPVVIQQMPDLSSEAMQT